MSDRGTGATSRLVREAIILALAKRKVLMVGPTDALADGYMRRVRQIVTRLQLGHDFDWYYIAAKGLRYWQNNRDAIEKRGVIVLADPEVTLCAARMPRAVTSKGIPDPWPV